MSHVGLMVPCTSPHPSLRESVELRSYCFWEDLPPQEAAMPAAVHMTTAWGKQEASCHMTLGHWLAVGSLPCHTLLAMLQKHRKPLHCVMQ